MNIEVGKFYRTRDGRKARIYAVDGGGDCPVHGAVMYSNGVWNTVLWNNDGKYFHSIPEPYDLISEWSGDWKDSLVKRP